MFRKKPYRDLPDRRTARLALLAAALVVALGLLIGGAVVGPALSAAHAVAWVGLYVAAAVAGWRIWSVSGGVTRAPLAFTLYGAGLALNAAWAVAQLGGRWPDGALVALALLGPSAAGAVVQFRRIDRPAAWLLAPLLGWALYAVYLGAVAPPR